MELSGTPAWLTFLGAVLGGSLGVVGALVVALSERRKEIRTSASYLWADLHSFVTTVNMSENYCHEDDVTFAKACTEFYLDCPRLSDDFGFHAARILHIDPVMPTVLQQINVMRKFAERELDLLENREAHPKYYQQGFENAFVFALTLRDWANYALPVLDRTSRTDVSAFATRLWRRLRIRWGKRLSFVEVPEDVREVQEWEENDSKLPGEDNWMKRLEDEFEANCQEHWEELSTIGDELDEEDKYSVKVATSVDYDQ